MKIIPINLLNHYKEKTTSLCTVFRLELRNGEKLGFTSFDRDIVLEDEPDLIYKAFGGMTPTAIASSSEFNVDNLDVEGYVEDDRITESDLKAGKFDMAKVLIAELNWADKPYSTAKLNKKRVGNLGEVKIEKTKFVSEIRGMMQYLQNNIGSVFQATCRANLGDSKCGVNLVPLTFNSSVDSVISNRVIYCSLTNNDKYFNNGVIEFTSGLNLGLKFEVKSWIQSTGEIQLHIPASYVINEGDTFKIIRGCNKTIQVCQDIFENAINFRGEPHIPQIETLINA